MADQSTVIPGTEADQHIAILVQRSHEFSFAIMTISRCCKGGGMKRADVVQLAWGCGANVHAIRC